MGMKAGPPDAVEIKLCAETPDLRIGWLNRRSGWSVADRVGWRSGRGQVERHATELPTEPSTVTEQAPDGVVAAQSPAVLSPGCHRSNSIIIS